MAAPTSIDPADPYAQRDVLVTDEKDRWAIAIESVVTGDGQEILSGQSDEGLRILPLEIVVYPSV